ncbi:MAG: OsmC family protein [Bradyrhizobium sp.]|nr:OsmC family protein [Bradyrhizobium sp.]
MQPSEIKVALDRLSDALHANPERARVSHAPIVATVDDGLRCRVTGATGEKIETDMPRTMGGENAHPSPGWYFRASFAACCATVIAAQAARLGIALTKLEVTVTADGDTRGTLGLGEISAGYSELRTNVEIGASNASPEQLRDLVKWSAAHSPVGCTVHDAPANDLRVVFFEEKSTA